MSKFTLYFQTVIHVCLGLSLVRSWRSVWTVEIFKNIRRERCSRFRRWKKKTGEHGEYGVACVSTVVGGKRETGKIRLSANAMAGFQAEPPCLLLYCGTRQGRSGRTFVDVAVTKLPESAKPESMKEVAENWRKMSFTALKGLMQIQPFGQLSQTHSLHLQGSSKKTSPKRCNRREFGCRLRNNGER